MLSSPKVWESLGLRHFALFRGARDSGIRLLNSLACPKPAWVRNSILPYEVSPADSKSWFEVLRKWEERLCRFETPAIG
jgi:hypothetical protein